MFKHVAIVGKMEDFFYFCKKKQQFSVNYYFFCKNKKKNLPFPPLSRCVWISVALSFWTRWHSNWLSMFFIEIYYFDQKRSFFWRGGGGQKNSKQKKNNLKKWNFFNLDIVIVFWIPKGHREGKYTTNPENYTPPCRFFWDLIYTTQWIRSALLSLLPPQSFRAKFTPGNLFLKGGHNFEKMIVLGSTELTLFYK